MKILRCFTPIVMLLLASSVAATALAADATGAWTWNFKNNKGRSFDFTLNLKTEDDKLTGELLSGPQQRATPIENATLEGDQLSFDVTLERNGKTLSTKYEGKIEGDTIVGTQTGGRRPTDKDKPREWKATRSK